MGGPHPDEVNARLAALALPLAKHFILDGKIQNGGREWYGRGPDGAKWGVVIAGARRGAWQNFGDGNRGTKLISFLCAAACGDDARLAYRWAVNWLDGGVVPEARPAAPSTKRWEEPAPTVTGKQLYLSGEAFDWNNPVGRYLVGRGIGPEDMPAKLGALRYHRWVSNSDLGRHMPAMLAPVIPARDAYRHQATHRTYLEAAPDGGWRKARIEKAKKIIGSPRGGVIPLLKGASRKPWSQMPAGERLILGEGIENTLTAACGYPEWRAAAYVSAGNLASLELPDAVRTVMLVVDRDGENRAVRETRENAIVYWQELGLSVELWTPPDGVKDANDFLQSLDTAA